jgi:uncharacterized protein YjbI with pentapeptide repeats
MKAKEVLRRYATGERDFRGANLCGQNFSEKDLSGANFSDVNIQGTNFNKAILRGTNFTGAKAGIQQYLITGLLIASSVFSVSCVVVAAGYGSNCKNIRIQVFQRSSSVPLFRKKELENNGNKIPYFLNRSEVIYLSCNLYTLPTYEIFNILAFISLAIYLICILIKASVKHIITSVIASSVISMLVTTHALTIGLVPISGFISFSALTIHTLIPIGILLSTYFVYQLYFVLYFKSTIFLANLLPKDSLWGKNLESSFYLNRAFAYLVFTFILGKFCTSFRGSDLIEANFTRAEIGHTDFRKANLINAHWYQCQNIDLANFGNIAIEDSRIQQLLTTLQGARQDYSHLDLSGINLQGADLQGANFMGANLHISNLQDADLSRANLKQAQLDSTDLTGATLTGAYIEDWRITGMTNLQGVKCEYVFMHVPTESDPDPLRKPDNKKEIFDDREFATFVKPYVDILDLYHRQDFDPRAISIAFENLVQNHPEAELEIVAMEKQGPTGFNLKVRTTPTANKSELSEEYFTDYSRFKKLPPGVQLLLAEKDARIGSLEQMIQKKLEQPTYKIRGDFMPENSEINISGVTGSNISGIVGGGNSGVAGQNMTGVAGGDISGTVTSTINQLPNSSEPDKPGIKELLIQLQQAIEETIELSVGEKVLLLEQVKVFADAKQTSEPEKRTGLVQKAKLIFEAILKVLPDTAKLAETCNKLLPMILKALGLSI